MPIIFVNGQFYFNLSSKIWSHFFGTQCRMMKMLKKFEDTYTHFDKIHERGRQTNGRTDGRTPRDDVGRAYP